MIVLNVVSLREGLRRENEIAEGDKENDCRSGVALVGPHQQVWPRKPAPVALSARQVEV